MSTAHAVPNKSLVDFIADQNSDSSALGINEMVSHFNTSLRTLRLYETRGLLIPHQKNGERQYDSEAQQRFRLIDQSRKLGFTLTEIADFLKPVGKVSELKLAIGMIAEQIRYLEYQRGRIDQTLADLRRRYYLLNDTGDDE